MIRDWTYSWHFLLRLFTSGCNFSVLPSVYQLRGRPYWGITIIIQLQYISLCGISCKTDFQFQTSHALIDVWRPPVSTRNYDILLCEWRPIRVPFSHLFTELQISAIELHISPIQLPIGPYLQIGWLWDISNWIAHISKSIQWINVKTARAVFTFIHWIADICNWTAQH